MHFSCLAVVRTQLTGKGLAPCLWLLILPLKHFRNVPPVSNHPCAPSHIHSITWDSFPDNHSACWERGTS
ncbi:uncharacterized [Tachysurus ichikawai]